MNKTGDGSVSCNIRQGTVLCLERNYLKYFSTSPFVSPHNLEI